MFRESPRLVRLSFALILLSFVTASRVWAQQAGNLRLGKQAYADGRYVQAETHLRAAVEAAEAGDSDQENVSACADLAAVLLTTGRLSEAEQLFTRALEIAEHSSSVDPASVPLILGQLAAVYQRTERIELAEAALNRVFLLSERAFPGPALMATLHNTAGAVYLLKGNSKQAERHLTRALALAETQPDGGDNTLGLILTNLAALRFAQQKWSVAESLSLRSLAASEQSVGKDHPDLAWPLTNLGFLRYRQRDFAGAEAFLKRSLDIRRKAFGADNIDTALAAANLAQTVAARGDYAEAQHLYATSLEVQERLWGPKNPQIAATLERFATVLRRMSQNVQADEMDARARSLRAQEKYTVKAYR